MKKTLLSMFALAIASVSYAQCDAGELASTEAQFVCPAEDAIFETDGTEVIPAAPGGYAVVFTPTTGTGGINAELTLFGVTPPYSFDAGLNGILAANSLPNFEGEWSVRGITYTDDADLQNTICDSTAMSFLVTFLPASDPECAGSGECPDGEIADCNGNCAPAEWVGDGFCDDGSFEHNGVPIFFNCDEFENDGGDCDEGPVDCTTWVNPSPTTGWSDFNTTFGGAPVPDGDTCPFNEIDAFEVWKKEAYAMDNAVAGTCYTFSHCSGPGAGSWTPYYAIYAPSGNLEYEGLGDGDGCSVTWVAAEEGTYLIAINDADDCSDAGQVDNGFPALTCNSESCAGVSVEENEAASFSIFPNPNNGQFVIDYAGESGNATIEVIEISGKVISTEVTNISNGSRIDMNLGNVRGMYFVRVSINNASQIHKVVIN